MLNEIKFLGGRQHLPFRSPELHATSGLFGCQALDDLIDAARVVCCSMLLSLLHGIQQHMASGLFAATLVLTVLLVEGLPGSPW